MKWFQVDSDTPNDPKVKAVIRRGLHPANPGQAAAGALWLLWCYVANHGGGRPGEGVDGDGRPLPLDEMADECLFDSQGDLVTFLGFLADKRHIDPERWAGGVVFLPAMEKRADSYAKSKGRGGKVRDEAGGNSPGREGSLFDPPLQDTTDQDTTDQVSPDQLVAVWNEHRKPGPKVGSDLSDNRRRAFARALKTQPDLAVWTQVICWINTQKWCNAQGTGDHQNWRADLDFLARPGKLQQMAEKMKADAAGPVRMVNGRTGVTPGKYGNGDDPS